VVDPPDVARHVQRLDDVVLDKGERLVARQVRDVLALAGDEVVHPDDLVPLAQ
jgi:hypothetical protein